MEFSQGTARIKYVKFSDAMRLSHLEKKNSWLPIKKCETEISVKERSASPSIKLAQFVLTLA